MPIRKLNLQVTPGEKTRSADFNRTTNKVDEIIDNVNSHARTLQNVAQLLGDASFTLITMDEFKAIRPKLFRNYYVAKDSNDKARGKCWKIYLGSQLIGSFNVDGSLTLPVFPMRFPFRLS